MADAVLPAFSTKRPETGREADDILVVVALDGSHHAEMALNWYIDHVHREGYTVLLLNIANRPYLSSEQVIYMSSELWEEMMNKEKAKFKNIEKHYAKLMEDRRVNGSIRTVFHNKHAEGIVEFAKEEDAAMIVMGSHGTGTEQRTLGGIAQHVIHHAHCPVIVWRHAHCSHTSQRWDKVLVYM